MKGNIQHHIGDLDVVVVGGGLAGLAVATYLARAGRKVTLFEKSSHIGGRAITQERGGFYFNLGAHALHADSQATKVLNELGVRYSGGKPGPIWAVQDDKLHLFPSGPLSLLRTSLLDPASKWEVGRLLFALQSMKPEDVVGVSLNEWIGKATSNPQVRRFLEASARVLTYTNAPDLLSAGLFAEQVRMASKGGVIYLDGGWQTLVDGLGRAARQAGVEIATGSKVEAVEHGPQGVTGVRLQDGRTYGVGAVVIAASPGVASSLVDNGENQVLSDWARQSVSAQFACLDVALRRLPHPEHPVVVGVDRPLFFSAQSLYSKVAPAGAALAYSVKYLDPSAQSDPQADRQELEGWLDLLQPGWRGEIVEQRFLPRMVVSNAIVEARRGGTTGRPGPAVTNIDNLYVAGDWVGSKGMLLSASLASARLAAQMITGAGEQAAARLAA